MINNIISCEFSIDTACVKLNSPTAQWYQLTAMQLKTNMQTICTKHPSLSISSITSL